MTAFLLAWSLAAGPSLRKSSFLHSCPTAHSHRKKHLASSMLNRSSLKTGFSVDPARLHAVQRTKCHRTDRCWQLRLSQIRVPTLVLVGDADVADVFAYSGAIEAAVPLASFEVWKDTGHLVQIQKPVELVARFNRFFSLATREEVDLAERKLAIYTG